MNHLISAPSAASPAKLSMLLLGSLACVFTAATAGAAGTPGAREADVPSITVKYSPQSLQTEAGVRELYRRITYAAAAVCPDQSLRNLGVHQAIEACRNAAIDRAIREIDNPRLAALHDAGSKRG